MKTLVTGATGFIGSHLAELLLQRGNTVRCLVRRSSDLQWVKKQEVELVFGDLFDEAALEQAVDGVEYIYHSAGVTKSKTPEGYLLGNRTGTRNLLAAAARHATGLKRFVQISSQTATGPSPSSTPISEDAPAHPITTYGRSKWEAEQECHAMTSRLPITIVRPPAVYGPRDRDVFEFFQTMAKGLQPMVGFHEKYVSLIHVADLVRGFVMAGESPVSAGRTYFITSAETYGWKEIGDITREVMGTRAIRVRIPEAGVYVIAAFAELFALFSSKPALINFEKARDMVQDYWTCSGARAKADFGFEPQLGLREGIGGTVEWYRNKGWMK
jgi:nucleoside-diphosphate-sugar epimerase